MTNAYFLVPILALLSGGTIGYIVGRYQAALMNKIRTLEEQRRVPVKVPEKPAVVSGAYQPPKEISTTVDTTHKAGIVEAKTPQLLDWEAKQALEKQIQGA